MRDCGGDGAAPAGHGIAVHELRLVSHITLALAPGILPFSSADAMTVAALLGLVYLVCLGVLGLRLGRRWISWVALTVLTPPYGSFFSYFSGAATQALAKARES